MIYSYLFCLGVHYITIWQKTVLWWKKMENVVNNLFVTSIKPFLNLKVVAREEHQME